MARVKVWSKEFYEKTENIMEANIYRSYKGVRIPVYGRDYFGTFDVADTIDLKQQLMCASIDPCKIIGETGRHARIITFNKTDK